MGLRAKVIEAMRKTRKTRAKLEAYILRIKNKERELMERLIEAQRNGDELRAKMYANEIAKLRKFLQTITAMEVKLEHAELKLQSVLLLGDAGAALRPVVAEIKELAVPIKAMLPEIEEEMDELIDAVDRIAEEDVVGESFTDIFVDYEAQKILNEAKVIAQKRLEESLAVASGEGSKA